jgi:3'-phosphoadenosine 5'-phosphosulfate sulfotransferase (PAPS reductase)/FAD synthetase
VASAASLVEEAVEKIRLFHQAFRPRFLWVPVSGGKDSAAVWGLAEEARVPYVAVYIQIPGQSHWDNVSAVLRQAQRLGLDRAGPVVVSETRRIKTRLQEALSGCSPPCLLHVVAYSHRGEDFWTAMRRYGYPAPLGRFGKGTRWCCGTFKHRVLGRLPPNGERAGTPWRYGMDGVKATDSPYRARRYTEDIITWPRTRDTYLFPLRLLHDNQVWAILEELGLADTVRPQYEKWGRSPNCMFCPMIGRRDLIEKAARNMTPAMRRLVARELEALLPRYKPTTFSHRSIKKWLEAIDIVEATQEPPHAATQPGEAQAET